MYSQTQLDLSRHDYTNSIVCRNCCRYTVSACEMIIIIVFFFKLMYLKKIPKITIMLVFLCSIYDFSAELCTYKE